MSETKASPPPAPPARAGAPGTGRRVIKKYRNRRLYDTGTSRYITLEAVRELVMERVDFVVQDAKDGSDLTRDVLLQALLEQEAAGEPIFSERALAEMIRFYGVASHGLMGTYLERNIAAVARMQGEWAEQSGMVGPEFWSRLLQAQSMVHRYLVALQVQQSGEWILQVQNYIAKQAEQALEALRFDR